MKSDKYPCPKCHGRNTTIRGRRKGGRTSYQCSDCLKAGRKSYFTVSQRDQMPIEESSEIEYKGDHINVVCVSEQVLDEEQTAKRFKIDLTKWELDSFKVKITWGYRKDRKSSWGIGASGHVKPGSFVEDSGKMLLVPMHNVHASYVKKVAEVNAREIIEQMMKDAKSHAPIYKSIKHTEYPDGLIYELDLPDLHLGKLAWAEETGQNYDIRIATDAAMAAIEDLLSRVRGIPIKGILFPHGNDFYNVNGAGETTVNGTKQIEDTRWQKTFRLGRQLSVGMIDLARLVAPVDVPIIPGNHDRERMFYVGDALECWYHNCNDVSVDNRAVTRKYRSWAKNFVGFAHGSDEKLQVLKDLMQLEQAEAWGRSKHREFHVGDKHHKEVLYQRVKEERGVVIRLMRSLTPPDDWHFRSGFVGAEQAAQGFLWHPEDGIVAEYESMRHP